MDKKASEKIEAGMFLLYLVIIAGGVMVVLSSYVNTPVDVRGYESQILYDKIMNCFVSEGFINGEVIETNFKLFTSCNISSSVLDDSNIYFEFRFLDETGNELKSFRGGENLERVSKKKDCEVMSATQTKNLTSCLFRNETYLYAKGNDIMNVKIVGWVSSDNQGVRK